MKDLLIILKNSPYRTELSKITLDLAITFATFEQAVSILIIGDGCLQLYPNQNTEAVDHRNHLKTLTSLGFYDIDNIYIEENSLENTGLNPDELNENFNIITNDLAKSLIKKHDHVLSF